MQRRELKSGTITSLNNQNVASHAEAWIEIGDGQNKQWRDYVASHAEAWIEIPYNFCLKQIDFRCLLCRGVNWNTFCKEGVNWNLCRLSCRGVNWNRSATASLYFFSVASHVEAWIEIARYVLVLSTHKLPLVQRRELKYPWKGDNNNQWKLSLM